MIVLMACEASTKAKSKNTMPTVRPDTSETSTYYWELSTKVESRGFEAICVGQTHHMWWCTENWGGVHSGCSLQPSSAREAWSLISRHTWDPAGFTLTLSLPSFPFLIEVLDLCSFPCLTLTQGSHFCPQTCFPPLEIFFEYLWDQRK